MTNKINNQIINTAMSWTDTCSNCEKHKLDCVCGEWGGEKADKKDLFTVVLTSVGTELISFRMRTKKITDEEERLLTEKIVKRIMRKLKEHNLPNHSPNSIF